MVVGRIGDEIGGRRIEGSGEGRGLVVEASVTEGAVHGVELHAVFEILIGGGERVGDARGVTLHGGVDGAHQQVVFHVGWFDVGGCGEETEHGETESAKDEDKQRDDDAE
jgi:hypothetical protein